MIGEALLLTAEDLLYGFLGWLALLVVFFLVGYVVLRILLWRESRRLSSVMEALDALEVESNPMRVIGGGSRGPDPQVTTRQFGAQIRDRGQR